MKRIGTLALLAIALFAVGCKSGEQTEVKKEELDNLYEKGIGQVMAEEEAKKGGAKAEAPPSIAAPDGKMVSETQDP